VPNQFLEWRACHGTKRTYPTRTRARLVICRIWLRERRIDSLQPYTCTWADHWERGRTAAPHIHIGHARRAYPERAGHWLRKYLLWPFYRLRRRVRAPFRALRRRYLGLDSL
jgi:hypothetical protein